MIRQLLLQLLHWRRLHVQRRLRRRRLKRRWVARSLQPRQVDDEASAIVIAVPRVDRCAEHRVRDAGQRGSGRHLHGGREAQRHDVLGRHESKDAVRGQDEILLARLPCHRHDLGKARDNVPLDRALRLRPIISQRPRRCKPARGPRQGDAVVGRDGPARIQDPLNLLRLRVLDIVVVGEVLRRIPVRQDAAAVAAIGHDNVRGTDRGREHTSSRCPQREACRLLKRVRRREGLQERVLEPALAEVRRLRQQWWEVPAHKVGG
mmetsp:Transcript_101900/g.292397  ORF Transcript_101900/g.292397 Transcript_101900/m.292397 type:complete len:263 (-) Transcript_101900:310-1098(-)